MKISQNSSLYKLARLGWMSERNTRSTNLCAVFWCSLWGLCIAIGMTVGLSFATYVLLEGPIISIIGFLVTGIWSPDDLVSIGMIIDSVILSLVAIGGIVIGWEKYWDWKKENQPEYFVQREEKRRHREENPGLLRAAYRGWKEKTCVMIQFEDA